MNASSGVDEKGRAAPEQDRVDVQADFVDDARGDESAREVAAAHQTDIASVTLLEISYELTGVVLHERHPLPCDLGERSREHVCVHLAGATAAALCGRKIPRLPSHQDRVDVLPVVP